MALAIISFTNSVSAAAFPSVDDTATTNATTLAQSSDGWARFCDDTTCGVNCGQWVSAANPGCLGESGRHSMQLKTSNDDLEVGLVYSPGDKCNCQTECAILNGNGCNILDEYLASSTFSYRLINVSPESGTSCDGSNNNCP